MRSQQAQAGRLLLTGFIGVIRVAGPVLVTVRKRVARRDDPADLLDAGGEQFQRVCQVFENFAEDDSIETVELGR